MGKRRQPSRPLHTARHWLVSNLGHPWSLVHQLGDQPQASAEVGAAVAPPNPSKGRIAQRVVAAVWGLAAIGLSTVGILGPGHCLPNIYFCSLNGHHNKYPIPAWFNCYRVLFLGWPLPTGNKPCIARGWLSSSRLCGRLILNRHLVVPSAEAGFVYTPQMFREENCLYFDAKIRISTLERYSVSSLISKKE
jgi:hypothetical protein